jgi:threonyl-tRNA synthetase
MADINDKIRKALFLPATAHARYNLEGALHDLERLRGMDLPPDMVCIHTIDRVIKQLAKAEKVLDGDG